MIEEFVSRSMALRDAVHLAHLTASGPGSYAKHMALGDFYGALIDKMDTIVEAYQGINQTIIGTVTPFPYSPKDPLAQIIAFGNWVNQNRQKITGGSSVLENLIDELGQLIASVAYKLRFLA